MLHPFALLCIIIVALLVIDECFVGQVGPVDPLAQQSPTEQRNSD